MPSSEFARYLKRPISDDNEKRSNANINSENPMGAMLHYGAAMSKKEYLKDIPEKYAKAHRAGYIHIHDLDFYDLTTTCCQISIDKLFKSGFGNMRPPKRIQSAFMQLCIAIQSNQNDQYGGQSIIDYDIGLTHIIKQCYEAMLLKKDSAGNINLSLDWKVECQHLIQEQVEQGCESMIHNLNTMNSRAGAQVPFSSINYGLGPAYFRAIGDGMGEKFAIMLIHATIKATQRGLANGETPRYPIQIYRVKAGVNLNVEDPYFLTTQRALKCTAERAYPNYIFMDNAGNDDGFDITRPETHIGTMGCRTRVFADIFGDNTSYGRGNASFCTINLPRLGIVSKTKEEFYSRLCNTMGIVADQLQYRFTRQCKRRPTAYPSLVGDGIGIEAAKCIATNDMWPMLKHFTLSLGFIGIHECLNALKRTGITDVTHDSILSFMDYQIRQYTLKRKLNYSLLATPAEGLCERFLKIDRREFGIIEGVTDKEYYTNSYHVPVWQEIDIFKKLEFEGKYHKFCNAGHISYVEVNDDISKNDQALNDILWAMHHYGIGYGAINTPLDHCDECHFNGAIEKECPSCGSERITRIRRITGYLAYLDRFNDGKRDEERRRVKHSITNDSIE